MAPNTPNVLGQPRVREETTKTAYVPNAPTSSISAPTTPIGPQYRDMTARRSGMRTISAHDFVGMGGPPAPQHNTRKTDEDSFAQPISLPNASGTQFNTQERPRLTFRDSQVEDMQAYVEDSDSENGSTLGNLASPRSISHDTIGSQKEDSGEVRKDEGKGKVGSDGENKRAR